MSHVPLPHSGRFLHPWFRHLGPWPKMAPPRGVPRWVSGYRPAPWWTVMQTTSHVPHPPSGRFQCPWFPQLGPGPKMQPPRGVPRWVLGDRPAPWWTVMQTTCHMFLIHLVEDFCALGFPNWGLGPRWHSLGALGGAEIGLGL